MKFPNSDSQFGRKTLKFFNSAKKTSFKNEISCNLSNTIELFTIYVWRNRFWHNKKESVFLSNDKDKANTIIANKHKTYNIIHKYVSHLSIRDRMGLMFKYSINKCHIISSLWMCWWTIAVLVIISIFLVNVL